MKYLLIQNIYPQNKCDLLYGCGSLFAVSIKDTAMDHVDMKSSICNTEAKMPTIKKTMKTINMRARSVSITAVISSGALSVNTKKY